MDQKLNLDALLWSLVNGFIRTNDISGFINNTKEDLFSEARVAAVIAISKYKARKNVKLSTWVYRCVLNHLINIRRYEMRKPPLVFDELRVEDGYSLAEMEFDMAMRQILTEKEYLVFYRVFVEDQSLRGIAKSGELTEWEAKQCLVRVLRRYKYLDKIRGQISTRRLLQENWLGSSEPSLH